MIRSFGWIGHRSATVGNRPAASMVPKRRAKMISPSRADYEFARLAGTVTEAVSLTISHRNKRQTFLNPCASWFRKITKSSGWNATTKSSPSRLIDTRRPGPLLIGVISDIGARDLNFLHTQEEAA
jgi:hypothetical protein